MLTFQHCFSTRIFLDATSAGDQTTRGFILNRAKDPRERRDSAWVLRAAHDGGQHKKAAGSPAARFNRGGAHAH